MTFASRTAAFAALTLAGGSLPASAERTEEPWQPPVAGPVRVLRPFQAPVTEYGPGHRGVDLAIRPGQHALAAGPGRVSFSGRVAGRGVVVIAHSAELRTSYEPVDPAVRAGARVQVGAILGTVQRSAHCGAAGCLHWGLRRGRTYLDPMSLLDGHEEHGSVRLLPLEPGLSAGPRPTGCAGRTSPWSGSGRPGSPRARRSRRPGPG